MSDPTTDPNDTTSNTDPDHAADPLDDQSLHPGENTPAERHDPDPTDHPIQPAGQATSPASDAQAKDHQRTGDPEEDADAMNVDIFEDREMQRITVSLPREMVARIDAYQSANGLPSRSIAVTTILMSGPMPNTGDTPDLSNTPTAIAPGLTESGGHRNY